MSGSRFPTKSNPNLGPGPDGVKDYGFDGPDRDRCVTHTCIYTCGEHACDLLRKVAFGNNCLTQS